MKFIDINKFYGKLKMKCFEMPNTSYTNRQTAQLTYKSQLMSTDYQIYKEYIIVIIEVNA